MAFSPKIWGRTWQTEMIWVNGTSLRENMKEILFLVHSMRFGNIKMVLDKSRNMYRTQWCCWLDLRWVSHLGYGSVSLIENRPSGVMSLGKFCIPDKRKNTILRSQLKYSLSCSPRRLLTTVAHQVARKCMSCQSMGRNSEWLQCTSQTNIPLCEWSA